MKDKAIQEKKLILFVNLEHLLNIWFCFMGRMILQTLRVFPSKKKAILAIAIMSTCITSIFDSATLSDAVLVILEEDHVGLEAITLHHYLF